MSTIILIPININFFSQTDLGANGSLESVSMIGPELCSLGQAWAPFIAPWCISLIMDIATKKSNVPSKYEYEHLRYLTQDPFFKRPKTLK